MGKFGWFIRFSLFDWPAMVICSVVVIPFVFFLLSFCSQTYTLHVPGPFWFSLHTTFIWSVLFYFCWWFLLTLFH